MKNVIVPQVNPAITSQASAPVHLATQAELAKNVSDCQTNARNSISWKKNQTYCFCSKWEMIKL